MKSVSGTLRLELAQYREKAAFSQFGSDLDEATQKQLTRGSKLVEVLKQKQYQPMPMEEQVVNIFAATKGYLDRCELLEIEDYQNQMLNFVKNNSDILKQLVEKEKFDEELENKLHQVLKDLNEQFF